MVQYVITLANSVIGVSVLALPFCFQQCGIVLATLMLICSAIMTRIVCHFLLKGGTISRRRTYELLAYHTYGHTGKLLAELTIIGFLLGTLIAFLVVMGDLGPQIVSEVFDVENNDSLRTIVMTGLALFVALPLGLMRSIDSLGSVSIITLMFYVVLVCKILASGVGPLWAGTCLSDLNYWRPAGILQCIPIIAMALSCQTQIFPIYDSLHEPTLSKMNSIVKNAVYLCTCFYFCVGFFGYVAFCREPVDGNILVNFKPTGSTQFIKCCFVFSIAFSVPLVVLPCRASLHSMIWRDSLAYHHIHEAASNYIPEGRLRLLTVLIIGTTLVIGLMIPNIELVLGLVGATAGSVICIIFPALMFISVTPKNTTEKLVARAILVLGIVILVMTTYATLYAVEKANVEDSNKLMQEQLQQLNDFSPKSSQEGLGKVEKYAPPKVKEVAAERKEEPPQPPPPEKVHVQEPVVEVQEKVPEVKQEQPQPPQNVQPVQEDLKQKEQEPDPIPEKEPIPLSPAKEQPQQQQEAEAMDKPEPKKGEPVNNNNVIPGVQVEKTKQIIQPEQKPVPLSLEPVIAQGAPADELQKPKPPQEVPQSLAKVQQGAQAPVAPAAEVPVPVKPDAAGGAAPAPEPPVAVAGAGAVIGSPNLTQSQAQAQAPSSSSSQKPVPVDGAVAEQLLKKIEKQQEEQRKLIEEQKQVLAELKKHHEEHDQADADADQGQVAPAPVNANADAGDSGVHAPVPEPVPETKLNPKEGEAEAAAAPAAVPAKVQMPAMQMQPQGNEAANSNVNANPKASVQEKLPEVQLQPHAQAQAQAPQLKAVPPIPISMNKSQQQPQKKDSGPGAAAKEPEKVNVGDL